MIVHLNGWPGVGKLTVGRILAHRLGARLIDNHLLHDVALICTGVGDAERWPLYETVRAAAYASLARRPEGEILVMTNALCAGSERERRAWAHVVDLAVTRRAWLVPIVLEADPREHERRLTSPDRLGRKLTDSDRLRADMLVDAIQRPAVPELLIIDATQSTPEETADVICAHISTLRASGLGFRPDDGGYRRIDAELSRSSAG